MVHRLLNLVVLSSLVACGAAEPTGETTPPTTTTGPTTTDTPPQTDARTAALDALQAAVGASIESPEAERAATQLQAIQRDGLLVGVTRAELERRLGSPTDGAGLSLEANQAAWSIGVVPAGQRTGAPTLIVDFDEQASATRARVLRAR